MPKNILVASPHPTFGELLRLSLEECCAYYVRLVQSCKEIEDISQRMNFDLALLDAELSDQPFPETVQRLMERFPNLKLIVFPPENNPQHPDMAGLRPHAYMNKPFYLPDLVEVIESLLSVPSAPASAMLAPPTPAPAWLQDVNTAAQHLTRLLLESSAQAALITRRTEIWAYAGHLDQPTAQEIATVMGRAWDKYAQTDLARFVRLENGGEFLVYATSLIGEMVLAMVYDVSMPLTRIRSQASKLARALASATNTAPQLPQPEEAVSPTAPEEEEMEGPDLSEQERLDILAMLSDMPSPDPEPNSEAALWQTEIFSLPATSEAIAEPPTAAQASEQEVVSLVVQEEPSIETRPAQASEQEVVSLVVEQEPCAETRPAQASEQEVVSFVVEEEPCAETQPAQATLLEETRPIVRQPVSEALPLALNDLDPAAPGLSYLAYTCILLPRFSEHFLTGELAAQLGQWLPELCVAFGWRLEGIAIRPEYLQWTLRVPPAVSPGALVRTLRQQTSQRVFHAFPHLKNPAEDFWAPGYLIVSGAQPPAADLLREYMEQTRRRQGKATRKSRKESVHASRSVSD